MVGTLTFLITFETILIGLLSFYGVTAGVIDISSTLDQITGPFPTISTSNSNCQFSASGPAGSCNVLDTMELGAVWIFASIGSIFYRIGAVFYLIFQLVSVLNVVVTGVPLLGAVFLGFQIILGLSAFIAIRSGNLNL